MLNKRKRNIVTFSIILFTAMVAFTIGIFQVLALNAPSVPLNRPLKMEGISKFFSSDTPDGSVDVDRAFFVGSDIFYNGDDDLEILFGLPFGIVSLIVKTENGSEVSQQTYEAPIANWQLNRINDDVQSYKISFILKKAETSEYTYREEDWNTYTVYNVSKYVSPVEIGTPFDLHLLSACVNFGIDNYAGKAVRLKNNIVLPNVANNHIMIGNDVNNSYFEGTFEGAFKTISGINMTASKSLAFFNNVSGTVQDLTLLGSINAKQGGNPAGLDVSLVASGLSLFCEDLVVLSCVVGIDLAVESGIMRAKAAGFFGSVNGDVIMVNSVYRGKISASGVIALVAVEVDNTKLDLVNCGNQGELVGADTASIVAEIDSAAVVNAYNFTCDLPVNDDGINLDTIDNDVLAGQFETYASIIMGIAPPSDIDKKFNITWVDFDEESEITTEYFNSTPECPDIFRSLSRSHDYEYTYTFLGWHTRSQLVSWHEDVYAKLPLVSTDVTFYAIYERHKIPKVIIDYNCLLENDEFLFSGTQVVAKEDLYKKYYTLAGYSFENITWSPGLVLLTRQDVNDIVVGDNIVIVYAIWRPVTVYITYDVQGAIRGEPLVNITALYGDTVALAGQSGWEYAGYDFFGWSTDPSASSGYSDTLLVGSALLDEFYLTGATSYNITLYAVWG